MVNTGVLVISEEQSASIMTHELAYAAAKQALAAAAVAGTESFPTVIGHGADPGNRFTIKSAATAELAGLKVGSYWPANDAKGMPRHSSTIMLLDQGTGRVSAVVEGSRVNAYRTAAADAVACDLLARPDAASLTIFGTGHQAFYECEAVTRIRPIETINVVGRDRNRTRDFVRKLRPLAPRVTAIPAREGCLGADIIVTATTAREPLFDAAWVRPGTHVASMGSDGPGKQELPPELLRSADLYADLPAQSLLIGEFQHLDQGRSKAVTAIGNVITGTARGRTDDDAVTVFDSSGIAVQDLYAAVAIINEHARATAVAHA